MDKIRLDVAPKEKQKALETALASFKKKYAGVLVSGEKSREELIEAIMKVQVISTGSLSLDSSLGVWGFPRGRVIELYGKEHSGKTSIALSAAGNCQRNGGNVVFIDVEQALDPLFAMQNGANYAKLLHMKPSSGEEAMNIVDECLKTNCEQGFPVYDMIVVDSVAALVTEGQIDSDVGKVEVAIGARLLSQTLRKITPFVHGCVVIFINQMRDKPGVMFGSHEDTPGGRALKYYSSVRCNISKAGALYLTDTGNIVDYNTNNKGKKIKEVGRTVKVTIDKNKVAPKGMPATFDYVENIGIVRNKELAQIGLDYGYIEQSGARYSLGNDKFHGFDNLAEHFLDNVTAETKLLEFVKQAVNTKRRQEIEKSLERLENQGRSFNMWQTAANKIGDVLDNDGDAPPPEE